MMDSGFRQSAGHLLSSIAAHSLITVRDVHHLTSLYMHDQYFSSTTILHGFFIVNHPNYLSDNFFTDFTLLLKTKTQKLFYLWVFYILLTVLLHQIFYFTKYIFPSLFPLTSQAPIQKTMTTIQEAFHDNSGTRSWCNIPCKSFRICRQWIKTACRKNQIRELL